MADEPGHSNASGPGFRVILVTLPQFLPRRAWGPVVTRNASYNSTILGFGFYNAGALCGEKFRFQTSTLDPPYRVSYSGLSCPGCRGAMGREHLLSPTPARAAAVGRGLSA